MRVRDADGDIWEGDDGKGFELEDTFFSGGFPNFTALERVWGPLHILPEDE